MAVDVHSDTVSVAHMPDDPFSGVVDEERKLHGRGSCDTKASLAICIGMSCICHLNACNNARPYVRESTCACMSVRACVYVPVNTCDGPCLVVYICVCFVSACADVAGWA